MILPDKTITLEKAIATIPDGATIMLGGFGVPGTPFAMIRELVRQGQKNLTIIKNGLGVSAQGPIPVGLAGVKEGESGINPYVYTWANGRARRRAIRMKASRFLQRNSFFSSFGERRLSIPNCTRAHAIFSCA